MSTEAAATKKDLAYYLAHTDEMPTDPKEIEALANQHMQAAMEQGTEAMTVDRFVKPAEKTDSTPAEEKPAPQDAAAKAEAETKAAVTASETAKPAEEKPADAKPDGILAKDGKNVIPYSQLESARDRAKAAETLVAEQAAELVRLKAEKETGKPAADDAKAGILTEEELTALEADSPTLAKVLRSQQSTIQNLTGTVKELAERQQGQVATEEAEVKSEIQQAIDANPTLAAWQADKDQTLWNEASKHDRTLRENPLYANVPFEKRFAKAVELTQAAMKVDEEPVPKAEEKPAPTQDEVKAAAQAALAAKAKAALPKSLSDIPGGAPPAVDEKQKVEQMSPVALGQQFMAMNKDQLEAYLANL